MLADKVTVAQHHLSDTVRTLANQERAFLEASVQFLTPAELHTLHSI